jgi:hypothetical protein
VFEQSVIFSNGCKVLIDIYYPGYSNRMKPPTAQMQRYKVHKGGKIYRLKVRVFKSAPIRYEIWCRKRGLLPRWRCIACVEELDQVRTTIQQCFGFMAVIERVR